MRTFCNLLLLLSLLLGQSFDALAQRRRPAAATQKRQELPEKPPRPSADSLIACYQFAEALEVLEKELRETSLTTAAKDSLQNLLRTALLGKQMSEAAEAVVLTDSQVVLRHELFDHLRLSASAGRILSSSGLALPAATTGKGAYMNELQDRIVFSLPDSTGALRLARAFREGEGWESPAFLPIADEHLGDEDFPFFLPDGQTLYFAARGEESLGGYDLFVSRYDTDSRCYLKPQNLGFPFNSLADDLLYALDEETGLGLYVTAHGHASADTLTIYYFQTETQASQRPVCQVGEMRFVINDAIVYHDLAEFRNAAARRIARESVEEAHRIDALEAELSDLRRRYAEGTEVEREKWSRRIITMEGELLKAKESLRQMEKNYRRYEINGR